jgi:hypothetical protein
LGGEQSGHVIFAEHNTTGDGIITALQVLATLVRSGKRLSELTACMRRFPQVLQNVRVRRREDLATFPAVQWEIQHAEEALAGCGRVLVRYSGTEPLRAAIEAGRDHGSCAGGEHRGGHSGGDGCDRSRVHWSITDSEAVAARVRAAKRQIDRTHAVTENGRCDATLVVRWIPDVT